MHDQHPPTHRRAVAASGIEEIQGEDAGEDGSDARSSAGSLPGTGSTSRRSTVAWWVVFSGPFAITLALLVAGIVADRQTVLLVFTIGVWTFALTLGLAAAPRVRPAVWWISALGVSFLSAAAAFGLLYVVSKLSNELPK